MRRPSARPTGMAATDLRPPTEISFGTSRQNSTPSAIASRPGAMKAARQLISQISPPAMRAAKAMPRLP